MADTINFTDLGLTGTGVVYQTGAKAFAKISYNSGTQTITANITGNAATVTTNANLTGDVTSVGNATTLATVNSNVGSFGSATQVGQYTVNEKGLITAASNISIQIAESQVTNLESDLASKANAGANTDITSVYLNNTGLKVKDTNASHGLTFKPNSDLTSDRILNFVTGDSDRSITFTGNPTVDDWFDQSVKTGAQPTFLGWTVTPSGTAVTNSQTVYRSVNLITSNSTPTNILSLSLDSGDAIHLEGYLLGSGGSDVIGGRVSITAKYVIAGSLVTADYSEVVIQTTNAFLSFTITANDSTKTIDVTVTGSGAMSWNLNYFYKKISPAG
jgi:hypothetical protein